MQIKPTLPVDINSTSRPSALLKLLKAVLTDIFLDGMAGLNGSIWHYERRHFKRISDEWVDELI